MIRDLRVGLKQPATTIFGLINQHNRNVKEIRKNYIGGTLLSGGVKRIADGIQSEIRCADRRVIVKTYRDKTRQIEEVHNG